MESRRRPFPDLRSFAGALEKSGELVRVRAEVDPAAGGLRDHPARRPARRPGAPLRTGAGRRLPAGHEPLRLDAPDRDRAGPAPSRDRRGAAVAGRTAESSVAQGLLVGARSARPNAVRPRLDAVPRAGPGSRGGSAHRPAPEPDDVAPRRRALRDLGSDADARSRRPAGETSASTGCTSSVPRRPACTGRA